MTSCAVVSALWVGISTMFTVGAGFENVHSFAFALYSGGTVAGLLLFVAFVVAGRHGDTRDE